MKISIRNLGAVREAEIDLKPLTIFIGPNSSGKTWTAYALAGVFGTYGREQYIGDEDRVLRDFPILNTLMQQVSAEGNATLDLVAFADHYGEAYFNAVAGRATHWMAEFLATERYSFAELQIRISLADSKPAFLQRVAHNGIDQPLAAGRNGDNALLRLLKEPDQPVLYVYSEGSVLNKLPPRAVKEFIVHNVCRALHNAVYPHVYTLPAERTAYSALRPAAGAVTKESAPFRGLTRPVTDFIQMSGDLFYAPRRDEQAGQEATAAIYLRLANLLEREILGGQVEFSTPEPDPRRQLLFRPNGSDNSLEITIAASLVKDLAPLTLYLRFLAAPGDLLVFDEPEINLHPRAQVQLAEFLGMLVNAGVNVVATSHSPYLVDHLANTIKAAEHPIPQSLIDQFFLGRQEAFIPAAQVSVCLFESQATRAVLGGEGLIDWTTFSEVADQSNALYFKL